MIKRANRNDFDQVFSIMERSFPLEEFRTYEAQKGLFGEPEYGMLALTDDEDKNCIIAFAAIWDFGAFAFLEHLAVAPECRNGGLGASMLHVLKEQLDKMICLEVEFPNTEMAKRRIGFYERNGFFLNRYDYIQPSLAKGRGEIPLMIMTSGRKISEDEFDYMRNLLYSKVYKISS